MTFTISEGFLRPVPGSAPILRGTIHHSPAPLRTCSRTAPVTLLRGQDIDSSDDLPARPRSSHSALLNSCPGPVVIVADRPLCDLADQSWLHQPSRSELLETIAQREAVIIMLLVYLAFAIICVFAF